MIRIYNTKERAKADFEAIQRGHVGMYVCGPTVYNRIHIGNARTFISFDVIRRYLLWRGFDVTFVQNVTDVDDKIINRANEEGRSAAEVAAEYTEAFIADMRAVGVMDPDVRPKATEEIPAMIELISELVEGGHAYEVEGDVYFSVRSYPGYGQLSGRNVDEMESGHRELRSDGQGLEDRKRDPLDFAVWKAAKPGEPGVGVAGDPAAGVAHRVFGHVAQVPGPAVRHPRWRCRPGVPASRERARPKRGGVRLHVRELLDARRHAADQLREDEQVAGQLQAAARRAEGHRSEGAALPYAADALPAARSTSPTSDWPRRARRCAVSRTR